MILHILFGVSDVVDKENILGSLDVDSNMTLSINSLVT